MSAPAAAAGVERSLQGALTAWALASATAGSGLWLLGRRTVRPALAAAGLQTALWGAVDGALVVVGAWRGRRRTEPTDSGRLRRVLLANAGADVLYVGAGALLAARPGAAARWLRRPSADERGVRGHGLAVVVQGLFLLVVDGAAARRLRS